METRRYISSELLKMESVVESEEKIDFKIYLDNAKCGNIPWNLFLSLMKDLCQSLPKAKDLISLILNELKYYIDKENEAKYCKDKFIGVSQNRDFVESVENDLEVEKDNTKDGDEKNEIKTELFMNEEGFNEDPERKPKHMNISGIDNIQVQHEPFEETEQLYTKDNHEDAESDFLEYDLAIKKSITENGAETNEVKDVDVEGSTEDPDPEEKVQIVTDQDPIYITSRCEKCSKSFKNEALLRNHVNFVHDKRFKCSRCDKSFGYKSALRRHVESVHLKVKVFQCEMCDKSFDAAKKLKRHFTKHIPIGIKLVQSKKIG